MGRQVRGAPLIEVMPHQLKESSTFYHSLWQMLIGMLLRAQHAAIVEQTWAAEVGGYECIAEERKVLTKQI